MSGPQQHRRVPIARKSSAPWDRLRPVKQDPLEAMGYVSKGDNRLLDIKTQESFYKTIVDRYMQFCTRHKTDLDAAFASLSLSSDTTTTPVQGTTSAAIRSTTTKPSTVAKPSTGGLSSSKWASEPTPRDTTPERAPAPEDELTAILMGLRKLREGLLATSSKASSPVFSQQVHIFNIRIAILALHPPAYHPSLSYLLAVLHTKRHPLSHSELSEMTTYMILDLALRQNDLVAAYTLRFDSRRIFNYENRMVDEILRAVVRNDWAAFWRIRRKVDGYVRAMMHWHVDTLRKATLKVFGRAYLKVDSRWLLKSVCGNEMTWKDLVAKEEIGWSLEGDTVIMRKPKVKS